MANTIQNRLVITGPNRETIERMLSTLVEYGMGYWRPMPTWLVDDWAESKPTSSDPLWRVWAFEHWGCKWDITKDTAELIEVDAEDDFIYGILHFNTANDSIEAFLIWWKTIFPEYEFDLEYTDIDCGSDQVYNFTTAEPMTDLEWATTVFFDALVEYDKVETDFYIQQSINSCIGWCNCLRKYGIEPSEDDMVDMRAMYKEAKGEEEC